MPEAALDAGFLNSRNLFVTAIVSALFHHRFSENYVMLILIDNYDSFTYNLVHYLGELGAESVVIRNDKISVDDVMAKKPQAIVLSPGPCTPNEAGVCLDLIKKAGPTIPLLGVCLGHQSIGQSYGGKVIRALVESERPPVDSAGLHGAQRLVRDRIEPAAADPRGGGIKQFQIGDFGFQIERERRITQGARPFIQSEIQNLKPEIT